MFAEDRRMVNRSKSEPGVVAMSPFPVGGLVSANDIRLKQFCDVEF
jgi:hypothetical protein